MTDEATGSGLTASEQKLIMSMIKNLKGGDFPTDWDAVAAECGYKNGPTAKNRWGNIKRGRNIGAIADSGEKKTPQKKRPTSRDTSEGVDGTPKSKRGRKGKKAQEEDVTITPVVKEEENAE